jgi:hypothetical protein
MKAVTPEKYSRRHNCVDITAQDISPAPDANWQAATFFVAWLLFSHFLIINLFLAFIVEGMVHVGVRRRTVGSWVTDSLENLNILIRLFVLVGFKANDGLTDADAHMNRYLRQVICEPRRVLPRLNSCLTSQGEQLSVREGLHI